MARSPCSPGGSLALAGLAFVASLAGPAHADVLHCKDGEALRGAVLATPTGFRVETPDGGVDVAGDDVLLVEERAALVAALAEKACGLKSGEQAMRVVAWAERKGLAAEAIALADRWLAQDEALVLPAALEAWPVLGVGARDILDERSAWRLLAAAGGKKPATARLAQARLSALLARDGGQTDVLARGMVDVRTGVRKAALEIAAQCRPEEIRDAVLRCLLFDHDETVRACAARAVQAYGADAFLGPVVSALGQDDPAVRVRALDALEFLDDERVLGALVRTFRRQGGALIHNHAAFTTQTSFVSDFDVEIAQAAVIAQPIVDVVQHGSVLDVAVAGVSARPVPLAERARLARLIQRLAAKRE